MNAPLDCVASVLNAEGIPHRHRLVIDAVFNRIPRSRIGLDALDKGRGYFEFPVHDHYVCVLSFS